MTAQDVKRRLENASLDDVLAMQKPVPDTAIVMRPAEKKEALGPPVSDRVARIFSASSGRASNPRQVYACSRSVLDCERHYHSGSSGREYEIQARDPAATFAAIGVIGPSQAR
jgi:hypothetical protein